MPIKQIIGAKCSGLTLFSVMEKRSVMKFFTDKSVKNDYLLIKITDYIKMKDFSNWKEVFIDPCVYELTKSDKFSWENNININEFLNLLPAEHFFSFDYPCDMNLKYTNLFLRKSWLNAEKYHGHSQYITTVQSPFGDYWSFVAWFDKYNALEIKSGILGLGNMCRFRTLNDYLKHSLDYAFSHCNHPRIHIYGLCLKAIPYAYRLSKRYNIESSIDSTKWTRACNKRLKEKYEGRICCRKDNRQEFFDEYKKKIEGVIL